VGLLDREFEVPSPNLAELTAGPLASQRQRWVGTRGNRQVHVTGQVLQEEGHGLVDHLSRDEVVIIEHQDQRPRPVELVQEDGERFIERAALERQCCDVMADARVDPLEGGNEVGQEASRIVVARVEREPGHRPATP
jgi:hypothetical protein